MASIEGHDEIEILMTRRGQPNILNSDYLAIRFGADGKGIDSWDS